MAKSWLYIVALILGVFLVSCASKHSIVPSPSLPTALSTTSSVEHVPTLDETSTNDSRNTSLTKPLGGREDTESIIPSTAKPVLTQNPTAIPTPSSTGRVETIIPVDGVLTSIVVSDVPHFDVHKSLSETLASRGPGLVYSRLLRLKTDHDISQPSLMLECDLCNSWEMIDLVTYRFDLKPNVLWQDIPPVNGRVLNAHDLIASYERQRTSGWPNAGLLSAVHYMTAEDELTLKIGLKFPDIDFLLALADGHSKVVSTEVLRSLDRLERGPVIGTGPWILRKYEAGVGSDLEANARYFENDLPKLKELSFRVIKDSDTRVAAVITGAVDVYNVPIDEWKMFESLGPNFRTVFSKQGGRGIILAMNVSEPPFEDLSMRRMVFKAIDPWVDLEEIWSGSGFVSLGVPVLEASWLLGREEMHGYFFSHGVDDDHLQANPIPFDVIVADFGDLDVNYATVLETSLRSLGFNPKVKLLNPIEYSKKVWLDKDYQVFVGPLPPSSSPNSYLFSVLHQAGQWNITGHQDKILDELIELQQIAGLGVNERKDHVKAIQRHLLDQAYMFSPLTYGTRWIFHNTVYGFYPNAALSEYFYWANVRRMM